MTTPTPASCIPTQYSYTGGNFSSGNTDLLQKEIIQTAIQNQANANAALYAQRPSIAPRYPTPTIPSTTTVLSLGANSSSALLRSQLQAYSQCSYNTNLQISLLKSIITPGSIQRNEACLNTLAANRFVQYFPPAPEIPPPPTTQEQINANAGRPYAPPGPCVNVIGIAQNRLI
jgi:hypothetical protein